MKYCFIFVCQKGDLELKSMLLAASLKRYLRCDYECVAAIPQPETQWGTVSEDTLVFMHDLGVRTVPITNTISKNYPVGNKVACLGIDTPADKLIFLDSDILCVHEFSPDTIPLNPSSIFGSFPESVERIRGIFTAPFSATPSWLPFTRDIKRWRQIYDLFKLPLPQWQILCPGIDKLMLPYFSSGFIAVSNGLGFAEIWEDCCQKINAEVSITNKYPWLDQLALPIAIARLNLTVNVLDERFNYVINQIPVPKDLPFFCHYSMSSLVRYEPKLNRLVNELADIYPLLRKSLLNSTWAQLFRPYTITEKFLCSIKRQKKIFKNQVRKRFHISSTQCQKDANVLGHSSGIKTR